jgi:hypothetical protein
MSKIFSIAFYNLENLFDSENNESTLDKDYTPDGIFQWDKTRYDEKINNLGLAISKIGEMRSSIPPVFIGVCEVENESCLQDLINTESLKPFGYQFFFHKSPDQRGIHVAFLFQKNHFDLIDTKIFTIDLDQDHGPDSTRDILLIKGKLFGEQVSILLNHWPSRTDGTKKTDNKRIKAAKIVHRIVTDLYAEDLHSKIIVMGDFNDDPLSKSVSKYLSDGFFNPMLSFQKEKKGSVKYKGKWIMFDQIILNNELLDSNWFNYEGAHIYVAPFLTQKTGRHKGSPKRTYLGKHFQGGYSDHYPVFVYFKIDKK